MLEELNEQQKAAACYQGSAKNILLEAGAGTGKTKTMVARGLFNLTELGVPPERLLFLTFTNKAARELRSRLVAATGEGAARISASTFHSFSINIIKKIPKSFGYAEMPTIIDVDGQKTLFKDALGAELNENPVDESQSALIPKVDEIMRVYSYARNGMRSLEEQLRQYGDTDGLTKMLMKRVVDRYEADKTQYNYADFDDLLYRFVEMAESKPNLAKAISELYDEILVDELQDTNPVQYRMLKLLGANHARIFGVGDPAQSIYGFRGADFKSIYGFTTLFPDSIRLKLSINYRSCQEILDSANALLAASTLNYDNFLVSHQGASGRKVQLKDFPSAVAEAQFIASDIAKRMQEGERLADMFVITRTAYLAREVEGALKRYKIPYEFVGGMAINKTAHVMDLMSILRTYDNHQDKLAVHRFLSMFKGIGAKSAQSAFQDIREAPRDKVGSLIGRHVRKESELATGLYEGVRKAVETGSNPVRAALSSGLEHLVTERYNDRTSYRISDLTVVADLFDQYEGNIKAFLADFALDPDQNQVIAESDPKDTLTIITAHSAKGLERKRCYIIGVAPGSFPSTRSIGSLDSEEEERRIMNVAITRAAEHLTMTRSLEFSHRVFLHAKTEVDFVEGIVETLAVEKKSHRGEGISGLAGLQDIY